MNIEVNDEKNYGKVNEIVLIVSKLEEKSEKDKENNTIAINKVEEVKIGNKISETTNIKNKKEISNSDKNEIKDYLSSVYDVKKKNIRINEN